MSAFLREPAFSRDYNEPSMGQKQTHPVLLRTCSWTTYGCLSAEYGLSSIFPPFYFFFFLFLKGKEKLREIFKWSKKSCEWFWVLLLLGNQSQDFQGFWCWLGCRTSNEFAASSWIRERKPRLTKRLHRGSYVIIFMRVINPPYKIPFLFLQMRKLRVREDT